MRRLIFSILALFIIGCAFAQERKPIGSVTYTSFDSTGAKVFESYKTYQHPASGKWCQVKDPIDPRTGKARHVNIDCIENGDLIVRRGVNNTYTYRESEPFTFEAIDSPKESILNLRRKNGKNYVIIDGVAYLRC